ncbi:MAG: hypothetical protein ABSA68_19725, partial [Xanthobacteraceae bacterium]
LPHHCPLPPLIASSPVNHGSRITSTDFCNKIGHERTSLISSPLFDDHRHFVRRGLVIAHAVIRVLHCHVSDVLVDAVAFNVLEVL